MVVVGHMLFPHGPSRISDAVPFLNHSLSSLKFIAALFFICLKFRALITHFLLERQEVTTVHSGDTDTGSSHFWEPVLPHRHWL